MCALADRRFHWDLWWCRLWPGWPGWARPPWLCWLRPEHRAEPDRRPNPGRPASRASRKDHRRAAGPPPQTALRPSSAAFPRRTRFPWIWPSLRSSCSPGVTSGKRRSTSAAPISPTTPPPTRPWPSSWAESPLPHRGAHKQDQDAGSKPHRLEDLEPLIRIVAGRSLGGRNGRYAHNWLFCVRQNPR
jgi:hypothetical protein